MKRNRKWLIATMLSLCLLLVTACGNDAYTGVQEEISGPWHKYSRELVLNVGQWVTDESAFPSGEGPDNNKVWDLVEQYTNIKLKASLTAPYGQTFVDRVAQLQFSDTLPDMTMMDLTTVHKAIREEQLVDLKPYIDQYGSPKLKKTLESNQAYVDSVTKNGHIYALPRCGDEQQQVSCLWIREDWIDRSGWVNSKGGRYPETFEEIKQLALAMRTNITDKTSDPTDAPVFFCNLLGDQALAFYNANNVYPSAFIKDKDGTIQDGMTYLSDDYKVADAVKEISEWDDANLFGTDWATQSVSSMEDRVASGKVGMEFGQFWGSLTKPVYGPMALKYNGSEGFEDCDWTVMPVPMHKADVDAGITMKPYANPGATEFYVVNKNYPNPEALIILINYLLKSDGENENCDAFNDALQSIFDDPTTKYDKNMLPVIFPDGTLTNAYWAEKLQAAYQVFIDGGKSDAAKAAAYENLGTTDATFKQYLSYYMYDYSAFPDHDPSDAKRQATFELERWKWIKVYLADGGVDACSSYGKENYVISAYVGAPTDAQRQYGGILQSNASVAFVNMIDDPASQVAASYAKFRQQYLSQGGSKILDEVRAALG